MQEWHEQEAGKARQARATSVLGASASELACPASRCQQCRIFSAAKSKSGSRQSENKSERGRERKRGKVCKRDSKSDAPSTASHVLLIFFSTWTPVAHASTLDHGECRRFVVSAAAGDDVAAVASVVAAVAAVALNA